MKKTSKNNRGVNGNKWLHPDIVGLQDLSQDWHEAVKECAKLSFAEHALLWSFEVKLKLNSSNLREAFFQAVSNSSWAHYGYLVAAEIDERAKEELSLLCNAHGIGFILLNAENPADSQIVIEAGSEKEVDWNTANRIAQENKDFREYIRTIGEFYKIGRIKNGDWYPLPQ